MKVKHVFCRILNAGISFYFLCCLFIKQESTHKNWCVVVPVGFQSDALHFLIGHCLILSHFEPSSGLGQLWEGQGMLRNHCV